MGYRSERLKDLIMIFGIDDKAESSVKISYYIDFVDQLENLAKIKDMLQQLEGEEDGLELELDKTYKEVMRSSNHKCGRQLPRLLLSQNKYPGPDDVAAQTILPQKMLFLEKHPLDWSCVLGTLLSECY